MNLASPFQLWIPIGTLDDSAIADYCHKQWQLTHAVRQMVQDDIQFWEGVELIEGSYSNVEIDEYLTRLNAFADNS